MNKSRGARPKVSVVCVSYNHEKYIQEALESFVAQKTNFPFEILVADDCSSDKTPQIIMSLAKKYPDLITPIIRKQNVGVVQNFVQTMRKARGGYIAICEGDDYWTDPQKLQVQADFMDAHEDYALSFHGVKVVVTSGREKDYISPKPDEKNFTNDELVRRNFIQTCSVMYRVQKYENIPKNMLPVDWYLHLYHAQFGKVGYIDRVMGVYRRHPGGIWQSSYTGMKSIWKDYSLNWLALQVALLDIYGNNSSYRKIISGSIVNLFDALVELDEENNTKLLARALVEYPVGGEIYIRNLLERSAALDMHSKEQAKVILHQKNQADHWERMYHGVEAENRRLKSRPLIRFDRAVKKSMKRKRR